MKKIFFPFYNRDSKLPNFWWHRLIVTLYFIFIVSLPFLLITFLVNDSIKVWKHCAAQFNDTDLIQWGKIVTSVCGENSIGNISEYWTISIISTIIAFYLLQIIYYKIVLYVVFGKKINELR